jgi:hypothetical protein
MKGPNALELAYLAVLFGLLWAAGCAKPQASSPKPLSPSAPVDTSLPATHREVPFIRPSPERIFEPAGVVVTKNSSIYIADRKTGLTIKFSAAGKYLATFSTQSENPSYRHYLLAGKDNSLWSCGDDDATLRHFSSTGGLLGAIKLFNSAKEAYDSFTVTSDPEGNVYFAGALNGTILVVKQFSPEGKLLWSHLPTLPGDKTRLDIAALAVAPGGQIWIWDMAEDDQKVIQLTSYPGGKFRVNEVAPSHSFGPRNFIAAAFDEQGNRYEVWFETAAGYGTDLCKFDDAGESLWSKNYEAMEGTGLALEARGKILLALRDYKFTAPACVVVDDRGQQVGTIGSNGTTPGELREPSGMLIDANDKVYVGDNYHNCIQQFSSRGKYLKEFIGPPSASDYPKMRETGGSLVQNSISLDRRGVMYVLILWYSGNETIACYSPAGKLMRSFPDIPLGHKGDHFSSYFGSGDSLPNTMGVDSKGNLWTATTPPPDWLGTSKTGQDVYRDHGIRLSKFDRKGKLLLAFERFGKAPGEFGKNNEAGYGTLLVIDRQDHFWVVDPANHRAQRFDSHGKFLTQIQPKAGPEVLRQPWGVALDRKGNIYLADTVRILKFSPKGEFLNLAAYLADTVPPSDSDDGLPYCGLTIDRHDNIYIIDAGAEAVRKFVPNK